MDFRHDNPTNLTPAEAELAAVCRTHGPFLQRFLLARGACPVDVEDIVQQVFTVFWEKRRAVPADKVPAFLCGIARNTLLAHKRKHQTRRSLEEGNPGAIADALHCEVPSPEIPLLQQERRQELARLVDRLPPRTARIIRMLYLEEGTRSEVAQALGIGRQTLCGAERRALTRLGELLRETGEPGP